MHAKSMRDMLLSDARASASARLACKASHALSDDLRRRLDLVHLALEIALRENATMGDAHSASEQQVEHLVGVLEEGAKNKHALADLHASEQVDTHVTKFETADMRFTESQQSQALAREQMDRTRIVQSGIAFTHTHTHTQTNSHTGVTGSLPPAPARGGGGEAGEGGAGWWVGRWRWETSAAAAYWQGMLAEQDRLRSLKRKKILQAKLDKQNRVRIARWTLNAQARTHLSTLSYSVSQ